MILYFIPSQNAIRFFPIITYCYEVFEHEQRLQRDPCVMAIRAKDYWAFECSKEIDLDTIQKFLAAPYAAHDLIVAVFDAKRGEWYGSPSKDLLFQSFPYQLRPNSLLTLHDCVGVEEID